MTIDIRKDNIRAFGVDWWPERLFCPSAREDYREEVGRDGLCHLSVDLTPLAPVRRERAAWWRRAGYHVLRPVVRAWRSLRRRVAPAEASCA